MKLLWFITALLGALSMAPAFAHFLEMPAKFSYDASLWLTISHTLYTRFGAIGGYCEIGAVVSSILLVIALRRHPSAFRWALAGAMCFAAAHAIYWIFIAPVNVTVAASTSETLPSNWMDLRKQWEYTHTARAMLQITGLALFLISILTEVPSTENGRRIPAVA
ncbi:MAG TPA: hypothetical protein VG796_03380 [Verrucomicrobiales bacterium]|nr:hypothetical protein [Verrucomicrobiales bacterium]